MRKFAGFFMGKLIVTFLGLLPIVLHGQHIFSAVEAGTYYGSAGDDVIRGIATDGAGNIFVVGNTNHGIEPGDTVRGPWDAFVVKLDASLENLLGSILIGGNGTDLAYDIETDTNGSVIISGRTSSSDFPTTVGAFKGTPTSNMESFVTRLSNDLAAIEASTLIGNVISDNTYGKVCLAIDTLQNIYVAGNTEDTVFPTSAGAFDESYNANTDAVLSKLSYDLTTLIGSTFLGDSSLDFVMDIAVDDGEVFAAGRTLSSAFPTTTSDTLMGSYDAFIAVFADDLQTLSGSRLFGGTGADEAAAIVPDGSGGAFVGGLTYSDTLFIGGFQDSLAGAGDGFVVRFNSALATQANTYLGGSLTETIDAMVLGTDDLLYVTGQTASSDFPKTWHGFDQVFENSEGFVCALTSDLNTMHAGGFVGGESDERCYGLVLAGTSVYLAGWTQSDTFWVTPSALDTTLSASTDGFVLKTGSLAADQQDPTGDQDLFWVQAGALHLKVDKPTAVRLEILAADGRLVFRQAVGTVSAGAHHIPLPALPAATYIITVHTSRGVFPLKYLTLIQ